MPQLAIRRAPAALCILSLLAVPPAAAQTARRTAQRPLPTPEQVPTLVVLITVDQMRADYFDRFGKELTSGLARLERGGAFFTNAFQDHAITETAPGHASTLSGRFPRSTGIVRNSAGVQDPQAPVIGAPRLNASPFRFRGTTLIDWLRTKDPRSRALSVSRKDRGAILPLGRAHQEVYWYDPGSGHFSTSRYYADTLPTWVRDFNARRLPASYAGRAWAPLLHAGHNETGTGDARGADGSERDSGFPHTLPADTAHAVHDFPNYPWMDEVTLAIALAGLRSLELGKGPQTDLLAISLSSTDAVGHLYGMESPELRDQILRLDRALGAFLDTLFMLRDSSHVVIALTADHGVTPTPELYTARTKRPTYRVSLRSVERSFRHALAERRVNSAAFAFEGGMLLVDRAAFARARVNADSVIGAFADTARHVPGVRRVDRLPTLARDTLRDPIARRWIHQIPPDLPVELVVTLQPNSVWSSSSPGVHGSPYDDDAHVPVLFYGRPFKPGRYTGFARVVDIAPTLAWITATLPTERLDGRVLWEGVR